MIYKLKNYRWFAWHFDIFRHQSVNTGLVSPSLSPRTPSVSPTEFPTHLIQELQGHLPAAWKGVCFFKRIQGKCEENMYCKRTSTANRCMMMYIYIHYRYMNMKWRNVWPWPWPARPQAERAAQKMVTWGEALGQPETKVSWGWELLYIYIIYTYIYIYTWLWSMVIFLSHHEFTTISALYGSAAPLTTGSKPFTRRQQRWNDYWSPGAIYTAQPAASKPKGRAACVALYWHGEIGGGNEVRCGSSMYIYIYNMGLYIYILILMVMISGKINRHYPCEAMSKIWLTPGRC